MVAKDQTKESDRKKLHKVYETHTAKLCQMLKTYGWPVAALVDRDGGVAAFQLLKNGGTFELQRDLLPVIAAVIKKDHGSWRSVQVSLVNRLDLVARTRPGYFASEFVRDQRQQRRPGCWVCRPGRGSGESSDLAGRRIGRDDARGRRGLRASGSAGSGDRSELILCLK